MPSRPKLPLLTLCLALAFYAGDANAQGAKASSAAEFARRRTSSNLASGSGLPMWLKLDRS